MAFFELEKTSTDCRARAGKIFTDSGVVETPVFMPVGTQGAVKALSPRNLDELGAQIVLGNTYHLYLRPGPEALERFGGLRKFMNRDGVILTDSGGYQVFSLKELRKLTDDGVEFRSHIDGSKHFFSPESVVGIQRAIGSDIAMVLDECTPYPATPEEARKSMELSLRWADRCKAEFEKTEPLYGGRGFLFGIGQGGMHEKLRREYIGRMVEIGFDGYAIGGLSVGEPTDTMYEITEACTEVLPEDKPRYLMGVGTPENLLECVELGIDMFDCVMPTRDARNGRLFTTEGKVNIRNAKYKLDDSPIDPELNSYASANFSRGYLRHLFIAGEILGLQLASMHNIAFYLDLMRRAREKILSDDYRRWKREILRKLNREDS